MNNVSMDDTRAVLQQLPESVRNALLGFRLDQGLKWKERLLMAWYNGNYPQRCQSGDLQQLRNHPDWGPWAFAILNDDAPQITDEMAAEFGFKSPLKLKVSKFYPVDIDAKVIYDAPCERERDVAAKWSLPVIGLPGRRLNDEPVYRNEFTLQVAPEPTAGRGRRMQGPSF